MRYSPLFNVGHKLGTKAVSIQALGMSRFILLFFHITTVNVVNLIQIRFYWPRQKRKKCQMRQPRETFKCMASFSLMFSTLKSRRNEESYISLYYLVHGYLQK